MKKRTIATLCLGAAWMLAACGAQEVDKPSLARPVVITHVEAMAIDERIAATGQLLARSRAEVAAQVRGEVTAILIDEGAAAEAGAVVLEIDPERHDLELARVRARVEEARAGVRESGRDVKRQRALAKRDVASKKQLDSSETSLSTSRSRLLAAEANLGVAERAVRDSKVRARFAGVIGRRTVSVGEYVQPGQKLFELVSLDPIEVEFFLPEADASRAQLGQSLEVEVAPYPDEVFSAVVSVVSPTIDSRTRTLRVKALLDNKDGRLLPGLFARTDLGIARREGVLVVPEEAVLQRATGPTIFRVVNGDRVELVHVELGDIRAGHVEIKSGLSAGDPIVGRGHETLFDGSVISARNPDGTPAVAAAPRSETGKATP